MATCSKCNQVATVLRMHKCAICFKPVCEKCALRRYSQMFCSEACAKIFFFPDET